MQVGGLGRTSGIGGYAEANCGGGQHAGFRVGLDGVAIDGWFDGGLFFCVFSGMILDDSGMILDLKDVTNKY